MNTTERPAGQAPAGDEQLLASLRQFIRTKGAAYLDDPNITSIGVGQKVVDGKPTGEVSIQFTVGEKVAPEALESLDTTPVPELIMVDGVPVPTDVIERDYRPSFRAVAEPEPPVTKVRLDPIKPGVSVGHIRSSAGTIGCIVYDRHDGTPLILSNWHVLHGAAGALGDTVVQPGPHDDNRVSANGLGRLVRSHLGVAGDCAVATIEERGFATAIQSLDVTPDQLGEPELGDKVIKSGRTTGVTHGVVRRVDVIAKLRYGSAGTHSIGGFEIGPDPDNPPVDGEISRGGDSGAAWIFKTPSGELTTVLAGLHFGGEAGDSPDEHALACLPQSVFEKLEITLRPPAAAEAGESVPHGFAGDFLGPRIDLPVLSAGLGSDAVRLSGSEIIPYTHFSLALSKSRRFARWVAWNIDGGSLKKLTRSGIDFIKDPRIPANFQIGDELYRGNRLDRGHLARRADLLWGPLDEAERANRDSFYFTNITPQMDDFNQSSKNGIWGQIEDAVFADADVDDLRVSAFGGPVLQDDDSAYRGVPLPREYWKVIAFMEHGQLKSRAFLLTQHLNQVEALELDEFRVFQVALAEVEDRTGVQFADLLRQADTFAVPEALGDRHPLEEPSDIQW
ncbi:DNA/RNA non-specific endonuclease [Pseudarthrobacter sp. NamB4]|uniref:DNA/RNA non-specific endonuclease n=1 Tax=Pseudarthrobacter sp. NamB4 TaxID=2576837 RepID=UPI0010FDE62A|nr:DNA/RNA non-specific endonuclease [Pseudarthrobacter sp. NamB4]TLM74525.1 DNA/RNA non-specific endonuclease [Pseudarthrobacter sp. NamB4]